MTTSERLKADYLTCSLCTNPFDQPKTLPCLHNFCKACLTAYLEQENSGGKSTTFKCPECKQKIYVPDPSKPVSRWASQFPTNFTLSGMVEAIAEEAEGQGGGGEKVKAAKERLRRRADDHSPGRVPAGKDSPRDSPDRPATLPERLIKVQDMVRSEGSDISYFLQDIKKDHQNQKKRLEMSFSKILNLIEGRKAQLIEELEQNFTEEKDRIQQAKQSSQHDLESLKSCGELLDGMGKKSLSKGVASDLLEAIEEQIREIEIRPTKLVPRSVKFEQKLEAGRSILNLIENLGSVTITTAGEVHKSEEHGTGEGSYDGSFGDDARLLAKPKLKSVISGKLSSGKHYQIYDITVMQSGTVVMMSYGNNVIQAAMNYESGYKVFSELKLDTEPKALVAISPHYVAVVGKFCIYIVGVTSTQLIMKQRIQTGKCYSGIAAYSDISLILTCKSPPSVDFVGLNGFISETIDKDLTTNSILFKKPQFITTSKDGVIYVIDVTTVPKLLGFNNAGKVLFRYPADDESEELQAPEGVACDSQGHIYVVDRESKTVSLLTPAGDKVKDILTADNGLTDPCAIAIDKDDNIYVTNDFCEVFIFQIR